MELSEDRLMKVFTRMLTVNRNDEPVTLAAKIVDRFKEEMDLADGGYGISPAKIVKEPEMADTEPELRQRWSATRPKLVPPKASQAAPLGAPPTEKRLVIGPDDPEFSAAANMTEEERRSILRGQTKSVRISRVGNPVGGPAAPPVKYWAPEAVIAEIQRNTPAELWFVPNGCGEDVQVHAVRDWLNQPGLDMVRLMYSNPGVSGDRVERDAGGEATAVFGLTAKEDLMLTSQTFDWDEIMERIVGQLRVLYSPKKKHLTGVELPEPPMDHWKPTADSMHASESSHWQASGYSQMGSDFKEVTTRDGRSYRIANPLGDAVESLVKSNQQAGNPQDRR